MDLKVLQICKENSRPSVYGIDDIIYDTFSLGSL